jgi:hypothetical protein
MEDERWLTRQPGQNDDSRTGRVLGHRLTECIRSDNDARCAVTLRRSARRMSLLTAVAIASLFAGWAPTPSLRLESQLVVEIR